MKFIQALSILTTLALSTEAASVRAAVARLAEGSSPADNDNPPRTATGGFTKKNGNDHERTKRNLSTFLKVEHIPLSKNTTNMAFATSNRTDHVTSGGTRRRKLSIHCNDLAGWYDSDGPNFDCNWYASTQGACENYGDGYENLGHTANTACCACKESSATASIVDVVEIFRGTSQVLDAIDDFRDASFHDARVRACMAVRNLQASTLVANLAKEIDSTITIALGFDITVVGFDADFAIEFIWGEDGQFACAEATSYGFSIGLLGAGASFSVAVSPRDLMGGWATVGADLRDPALCVALGYSPGPFGIAATAVLNPAMIAQSIGVGHIQSALSRVNTDFADLPPKEAILEALSYIIPDGLLNVGVEVNVGLDALDIIGVELVLPDINIAACDEVLTYCDGVGCAGKLMVEPWDDGDICGLGTTCNNCSNEATYWYGKAFTACGSEPQWNDGSICALGTTCNACANEASYWYGKAFTACGSEPCWSDGTRCLAGTSCNACCNDYEWWDSDFGHHCGSEPCWGDGTICAEGTTCSNCCRSSSYWWGKAFTACGDEPCWRRRTRCLAGTSCNNCCGDYSWSWGDFGHFCD